MEKEEAEVETEAEVKKAEERGGRRNQIKGDKANDQGPSRT